MILVIDNYDSFTFNLVQTLQAAGADVRVVRNDAIDKDGVEALAADPDADLRGIVVSPGPGDPASAGPTCQVAPPPPFDVAAPGFELAVDEEPGGPL